MAMGSRAGGLHAVVVASLFLALVTLCLPQAFAAQRMAIVRGTIIDQDGKPIEGVDVIIE